MIGGENGRRRLPREMKSFFLGVRRTKLRFNHTRRAQDDILCTFDSSFDNRTRSAGICVLRNV